MTLSASDFTAALALAANGVSVVTTDGSNGKAGLTVSSMVSVCAEPPLILACVNSANEFCDIADANEHFAVNILSTVHTELAGVFAGLGANSESDRFEYGDWISLETGSPILSDALVSLDCKLVSAKTQGTHRIYIGEVVAVQSNAAAALVYCNRAFVQTAALPDTTTDN